MTVGNDSVQIATMASRTVLCAFVLVLVAVCHSKPHHDQGFMSRGFQQERPEMDQLMAYNWQQKKAEHKQRDLEQGRSHKHHHHQEKRMQAQNQEQDSQESQSQEDSRQYKTQDMNQRKYQDQSDEDQYDQQRKSQQYRQQKSRENQSGEYEQPKKYGQQNKGKYEQESKEVYQRNYGKMQRCDEEDEENMDKPCVVDKQSKHVRVQDTSSDESQESQRKIIKAVVSREDSESVELKQARQPTPVYHGKGGPKYHYGQEQRHNVQTGRRGNDESESESEENSQERRNKVNKY